MKSIYFKVVILVCLVTKTNAQDSTIKLPEYGKVEVSELQMKDCSFAPGAPAVNLLKYAKVEISVFPNGNTEVATTTRYRIKIFNKKGYKNATVSIPFFRSSTLKLRNLHAATYNLDENNQVKVTTLKEDDIFKNEATKKDIRKSIKFTFPDVKEGSVIEFELVRKYRMAYEVPSWYFQDDIPNLLTVYKIVRPLSTRFRKRVIASLPVEESHMVDDLQGSGKKQIFDTYIMKNVPAFKGEAFMSSSHDYLYRMDFLIGQSESDFSIYKWSEINDGLLDLPEFGGAFKSKIPGTNSIIDSVKQLNNISDRIRAIYSYVKRNVRWGHVYNKYARDLEEVWKEGEGTSAEINLSILNLLRRCDVRCFPVLYSTRLNGKVDYEFPDLSQFNTVNIAVVNGKKFNLLDGTNPYLSNETPPFNVVNRTGMIIDPISFNTINIDFDRKLIWDSIYVAGSIASNGVFKGEIVKKYFDLAKSMKLQNAGEDESEEDKRLSQPEQGIKADSFWRVNTENELLPLIEHSTFHYELPVTNDFYFLNPFLFSNLSKNPFTDSIRISDIDFGASSASVVQMKIALPKGIKLEELAQNKEIYNTDSSIEFLYHNELRHDTVNISSSLEIRKPIFNKKDYEALKSTFERIYSLLNNQILFRKKDE